MSAKTKTLGKRPGGLSDRASDVVLVVLCVAILLVVAYPLYYILVASFSDDSILLGYWNSIKYTVVGTIFSVVMIYITAYPPVPSHHGGHGGVQHGGLLERLVHRPDLHDRRRPRPPAPGAAQYPHRQRNFRQPGQHDRRRVCRTEQAHRNDQVRLHHRGGRPPMLIHNCGTIPLTISLEGYGQMGRVDPGAAILFRLDRTGEDA